MAQFAFTVLGEGQSPVDLPVVVTPNFTFLNGLETKSLVVDISNPLSRDIVFTTVDITIGGPAGPKVGATIRFDNFTVPASGTFQNFLDVESKELIFEEETFAISVNATEATA